jgi:hypothetical protein
VADPGIARRVLGRLERIMPEIVLDLRHREEYEAGATLVTCLAYPGPSDTDETRGALHKTLCAIALRARYDVCPEWAAAPQWIKPIYAFVSQPEIMRNLRVRPESSCWIAELSQHQAD